MKLFKIVSLAFLMAGMGASCSGQGNNEQDTSVTKTGEVQVYYFHLTRRCVTCKTVQKESKKAVEALYGDKVSFTDYNLEKAEGKKKAEELGVHGQSLLIVGGGKKINITNEGFMYARSKPDKLKEIIKKKIDPLL